MSEWDVDIRRDYNDPTGQKTKSKRKKKTGGKTGGSSVIKQLMKLPENQVCADCEAKHLKFASVTFGVFLCRECGPAHVKELQGLSVVKDCTTDSFTKKEENIMRNMGNIKANSMYEAIIAEKPGRKKPFLSERFIKDKYKWKFFWNQSRKDFLPENVYGNIGETEELEKTNAKPKQRAAKKQEAKVAQPATQQHTDESEWGDFQDFMSPATNARTAKKATSGGKAKKKPKKVAEPVAVQSTGDWDPFSDDTSPATTSNNASSSSDPLADIFGDMGLSSTPNQPAQQQQQQQSSKSGLDVMSLFDSGPSNTNDNRAMKASMAFGGMTPNRPPAQMGYGQPQMGYGQPQMGYGMQQQQPQPNNSMDLFGFGNNNQQQQQQRPPANDWSGLGF